MAFHLTTQALKVPSATQGPSALSSQLLLVEVYGEADVFAAPALQDRFKHIINAGNLDIIVSLEKITFIDSSGLAVLINTYKYLKNHNGHFMIVCSRMQPHQMLFMTEIYALFPIVNNLEEAYQLAAKWHYTAPFITDRHIRKLLLWDNYIITTALLQIPSNLVIEPAENSCLMA